MKLKKKSELGFTKLAFSNPVNSTFRFLGGRKTWHYCWAQLDWEKDLHAGLGLWKSNLTKWPPFHRPCKFADTAPNIILFQWCIL